VRETRSASTNGRAVADFSMSTKTGNGFWSFNTVGFSQEARSASLLSRFSIHNRAMMMT
jgi:hypothetical protein